MMQPTDAVKLIYQNEFGGGHLIRDEAACINYLFREYQAVEKKSAELFDPIGNGLVRVNLSAIQQEKLPVLGQAFIRGAAQHHGSAAQFLDKIELLKELTLEGRFFFDLTQLLEYLEEYQPKECRAVSHSEIYRQQYRPSYRVIRYCDLITDIMDKNG